MQFVGLVPWVMLAIYGGRCSGRRKQTAMVLSLGLCLSMAGQMYLLHQDDLLNLSTGLPLHICGLMALLSLPMIWLGTELIYMVSLLLGMPCAFLAMCFPAVIHCSRPFLMAAHFNRLHGLILCCGIFLLAQKKPLPQKRKSAFFVCSGYLWLIWLLNPLLGSNYLFLRAVPSGTPLVWLAARGEMFLICSYEMLAMVMMLWLERFWRWIISAGSR